MAAVAVKPKRHSTKPKKKKNILLLLTDDQDVVLGSFDHMPHLRRYLQEEGTTYTNAFVHTPVCCPSRSSILTGRYLHNNVGGASLAHNNSISGNCYGQAWKDGTEPRHTLAVQAQASNYTTAYAGKYLNRYGRDGTQEVPPGYDHWYGLVGNSVYYNYEIIEGKKKKGSERSDVNDGSEAGGSGNETMKTTVHKHGKTYPDDYLPLVLRNYTLRLLDELNPKTQQGFDAQRDRDKNTHGGDSDNPWLMVVAWPTPHAPFTPEPWAVNTMDGTTPPKTPNYNASSTYMNDKHWLLRELHPLSERTAAQVDQYYQARLEALKTVDEHVRAMVWKLEELGALQDTLIIFTSDNGFQFGQHRLTIDKRHLYEHDIRVPFVVRGPGVHKNATSSKMVANIDIAPTILDLIHENQDSLPAGMDGLSIFDVRHGERKDILISYHGEGSSCGTADCPPPYDDIWWMPDAYNNTYHCVRTLNEDIRGDDGGNGENSIYCVFQDEERFVEYYNLTSNPHQLQNEYHMLSDHERSKYERRIQKLLSGPSLQEETHTISIH